jgi:uncharacterized protein YutD
MKIIEAENHKYELIENKDDCFDKEEFLNKYTDYFYDYDYILGDYAYGKVRLKGFCTKGNKKFNKINDFYNKDNYLKNECAYNCKYFLLKKCKNN